MMVPLTEAEHRHYPERTEKGQLVPPWDIKPLIRFHTQNVNPGSAAAVVAPRIMLSTKPIGSFFQFAAAIVEVQGIAAGIILEPQLLLFPILHCLLHRCSHSPEKASALSFAVSIHPHQPSNHTHCSAYSLSTFRQWTRKPGTWWVGNFGLEEKGDSKCKSFGPFKEAAELHTALLYPT